MKKYVFNNVQYSRLGEIKSLLPNVSFPVNPTDGQLAELGITVVTVEPPEPTLEELKQARLGEINAAKWAKIDGGTVFMGDRINTDADAQRLANGAVTQCLIDPDYTCRWKLTDGAFITADAGMITGMASAIRAHIQDCFDREAELAALVRTAGTAEKLGEIEISF